MDFISVIPPHVVGPFLMNSMPPSFIFSLSLLTGNEGHYSNLKKGHYVHLNDLCMCHIFLFEHPKAEGRYICCSHKATIHEIANLLHRKYPEYNVPTKFVNIPEDLEIAHFSTKKIEDFGFRFKYSLEDMFTAAIDTCREKGLLPKAAKALPYGTTD
ncbi:hypothetical protein K1719_035561 [Acacia pycnantha]|nr:hypothetical protein K1719_035561 [Acacia pycnantha]